MKPFSPSLSELNLKKYSIVSLQELLQNKGRFHGQFIQTKGLYHFGFEENAIYPYANISFGDTITKYIDFCGLWIDFNLNTPFYKNRKDSFINKLVIVKGYFDTTKTGHIGGCYRAALTNSLDLKIADETQ